MPQRLQPHLHGQVQKVLGARRDYVAEMMQAEYPHWSEKPMPGKNDHRKFEWTDDKGIGHIVSCGAGTHRESDSRMDQLFLRQRIRQCESGTCTHRPTGPESIAEPASPEESSGAGEGGGGGGNNNGPIFNVGQRVIYQGQPHFVSEVDRVEGVYAYGLVHAGTGAQDTALEEELMDGGGKRSNILDPIHDELDPDVWDYPDTDNPLLRPEHKKWIVETIYKYLDEAGYDGMDEWLSLVFTGSLTTYQYSPQSDVDISLFVDTVVFPDWSRAEMIGVMVNQLDGTTVPGTTHPIQCFVVPPEVTQEDLYKPGLRSGYDLETDTWIQPPERDRVMDVEKTMNTAYTLALESADKMELLLKYEPQEAVRYWHYIHDKRREDQRAGRGDFAPSNIVYKMLANRGLFEDISEVSGEYIAHTSNLMYEDFNDRLTRLEEELAEANRDFALNWPYMSDEQKTEHMLKVDEIKKQLATANEEYEAFYKAQPVYRRSRKVASPAPSDWWEDRYKDDSRKLYHGTRLDALDSILGNREGLVPWDKGPHGTPYADFVRPRPGHVYMGQNLRGAVNASQMSGAESPIVLRINPRHLKPELVNPDEDDFYDFDDEKWNESNGMFSYPKPEDGEQSNYVSLGDWAEAINLGADPEATAQHLQDRENHWTGIAYNGSVPFEAIEGLYVTSDDDEFHRRYPNAQYSDATGWYIPIENLGERQA